MKWLFFIFWVTSTFCIGQKKQAAIWTYGFGNKLDFKNSPPFHSYFLGVSQSGVSSICDTNGNLLFMANKDQVRTRFSSIMPQGLIGTQTNSANGQFIIPHPDSSYLFRLFLNINPNYTVLSRRTINMKLNQGLGDVDTTTIRTDFSFYIVDHLACMLHANGRDSWVISHVKNSDSLVAFLVTADGIVDTVFTKTYSQAKMPNLPKSIAYGYDCPLKSSPDSRLLFVPRRITEFPYHELYRFNRETGIFYDRLLIKDTLFSGNLFPFNFADGCFSPDSRLLYLTCGARRNTTNNTDGPGFFWQYNLENYDSIAIEQSKIRIGVLDRFNPLIPEERAYYPRMQLAIDGKIYISPGSFVDTLMSTIHCPDKIGIQCNIKFRDYNLRATPPPEIPGIWGRNGYFFPTLNQTFVRNAGIFQLQANKRKLCKGDTLELSGYGAGAEHFTWSVSPALPQTVKVDTLTWQKIATRNIPAGLYTFSCRATSRCGDLFEKSLQVEILPLPPKPNLVLVQKPVPCKGDSVIIRVQTPVSGNLYFWSTGDSTSSIVVKQTGLYSLDSVSNTFGCGIRVGDTVAVTIKNAVVPPVPQILGPKLVEVCEGQLAKLTVDNGQLTVNYRWSNGQIGDSILVVSGRYSVISESAEGCQSGSSDTAKVGEVPLPAVQIVALDSVRCQANEEEKEYKVISQNVEVKSVEILGGEIVKEGDSSLVVRWLEGTPTMAAEIKIRSYNRLNCEGPMAAFRPKSNLEICRSLYPLGIPNLVTLNSDGKNDLWELANLFYFQPVSLSIYNRWGKRIFQTNDYRNNWPEPGLEPGTYFYRIGVLVGDNRQGWIEVLK